MAAACARLYSLGNIHAGRARQSPEKTGRTCSDEADSPPSNDVARANFDPSCKRPHKSVKLSLVGCLRLLALRYPSIVKSWNAASGKRH